MKTTRFRLTIFAGVIVLILSVLMINSASISANASATNVSSDGKWKFQIINSDNATARLVCYTRESGNNVAIPGTVTGKNGKKYTVVEIGIPNKCVFNYVCVTKTLTIPASVEKINSYAFWSDKITNVRFEKNSKCKYIGEAAFSSARVSTVKFPASLETIGEGAFYGNCDTLTSVKFEDKSKCKTIGASAFGFATKLTSINIPKSVTSIGESAFEHCEALKVLTFEGGSICKTIGGSAFRGTGITRLDLPASIKSIGESAFLGCTGLVNIDIASDSLTVSSKAFATNVKTKLLRDSNGYLYERIIGEPCPYTGVIYVNNKNVKQECLEPQIVNSGSVIVRNYNIEMYVKSGSTWVKKVSKTVGYNQSVALSSIAPNAPTGFKYEWYKDSSFRDYAGDTICKASKDGVYRLYANTIEHLYTIIFMANDGTQNMTKKEDIKYTEFVDLPAGNGPARDGFWFKSWNTKADGTGTTYKGMVNRLTTENEITLFAIYDKVYSTYWFSLRSGINGKLVYQFRTSSTALGGYEGVVESPDQYLDADITYNYVDPDGNYKEIKKRISDIATGDGWIRIDYSTANYTQKYPNIDKQSDYASGSKYVASEDCGFLPNPVYKDLTIRFDGSSAENTMGDVTCVRGKLYADKLSNMLTKEAYEFAGWTVEQLEGTDDPTILISDSDIRENRINESKIYALYMFADKDLTVTLKPVWKAPETYNVLFKSGGGTGTMQMLTLECGKVSRIPDCTYKKKGYLFAGWAIDGENTVKYADGARINRTAQEGDIRLKAIWKQVTYKLVYDANGGQGFMSSENVASASLHKLKDSTYEKLGAKFNGWNMEKDGSGKSYRDGAQIQYEPENEGETITLYADWSPAPVIISFNANGGMVAKSQKTVEFGETCGVLPTARRDGYDFLGWFTRRTGGTQYSSGTEVDSDSDITLYAHWKERNYTVTFNTNGGNAVPNGVRTIMAGKSLGTLPTAKKDKATFAGWYTSPTGGSRVSASFKVNKDCTFYAHWTDLTRKVRVTFNVQKIKNTAGYEVQYSTSSGFGGAGTVYGKVSGGNVYVTQVGGLKAGTRYYFRARSYAIKNGRKTYGSWSSVSSKTTSK